MKLYGMLSSACLASLAGAALPLAAACPEGCEKACCTEPTEKTNVETLIELISEDGLPHIATFGSDDGHHVISTRTLGDDDQVSVVVKIINDDMSASVNGKDIHPDHIIHKDGKIIIKIEGRDDVVVPLHTGAWSGSKEDNHSIGWSSDAGGRFTFAPDGEGKSFAVFSDDVAKGLVKLGQPGKNHAIIGINISDADKNLLEQLGIKGAIRIDGIIDGTPAAKAGIRANDLLVQIDGVHGLNIKKLRGVLSGKKPGERVELKILRHGNSKDIELELAPSMSFGAFGEGATGSFIEMSPNIEIDFDVEDMIKGMNLGDGNIEFHADFQDELKKKLQGLHIEFAPLHEEIQGQLKGRVFAEMHDGSAGGIKVAPRLRLHAGEGADGVFSFDGGGANVFRFGEGGQDFSFGGDNDAGVEKRLGEISERMERIERKLDRLMRALERD